MATSLVKGSGYLVLALSAQLKEQEWVLVKALAQQIVHGGDVCAARLIFRSSLSFVLFDTGTYLRFPMQESERNVRPCGPLVDPDLAD